MCTLYTKNLYWSKLGELHDNILLKNIILSKFMRIIILGDIEIWDLTFFQVLENKALYINYINSTSSVFFNLFLTQIEESIANKKI